MIIAVALAMSSLLVNQDKLISALYEMENGGHGWNIQGGGLQWTRVAWKEETSLPYELAMHPPTAIMLAKQRLAKHAARFAHKGITPTPYLLASAWHHGWDGAYDLYSKHILDDYGDRARNLYLDFQ